MVKRFNLLGVLHLLCYVTLVWNNILQSEKIHLEKLKTVMLSGTYCIVWVVVTQAVIFHGVLYLCPLSGEESWRGWRGYTQQLNS